MALIDIFRPDQYVPTVYDVDYQKLWDQGIRGLFFDVDNTLIPFYEDQVPARAVKLLTDLRRKGFKVFILSNGRSERVKSIERQVQLKGSQMAVIGDQVFMDVWCGHRLRGQGILIEPIDRVRDEASVSKRRPKEKEILNRLGITLFCDRS